MKKFLSLILALTLLASLFCACESTKDNGDGTGTGTGTASGEGFSYLGKVDKELPYANADFTEWFEKAKAREQLTNAIYYAYDDGSALWHCWLYLGGYAEGDALDFNYDNTSNTLTIVWSGNDSADLDATALFPFTIAAAEEPTFDLYDGEETSLGILLTHAEEPVLCTANS